MSRENAGGQATELRGQLAVLRTTWLSLLSEMGTRGGVWAQACQDTTEVRFPLFASGDQVEMGKAGAETRGVLVWAGSDSA